MYQRCKLSEFVICRDFPINAQQSELNEKECSQSSDDDDADKTSIPHQAENSSGQHGNLSLCIGISHHSHLHIDMCEENNSEANANTCVSDTPESDRLPDGFKLQTSPPNSVAIYESVPTPVNPSPIPQECTKDVINATGGQRAFSTQDAAKQYSTKTLPSMLSSKGDHLISGNLAERGPNLLDIPNGHKSRNELVIAAHSNLSIPKLYPIVGFRKEPPGIALPPPIPLDLPKIDLNKKVSSRRQVVASSHQLPTLSHSIDPVSIISRAALFLTAGDYGATIEVLEILSKHSFLSDEVNMAKEFGQGLANFKNLHYRAAKPCFTALFEKASNHHSTGDQALASIYLGEIEMSWAKYKDAVKHFTIAVTYYGTDNVAEKFQQTILSKSAVLVKKGNCHRSLSQIKEAINAFKLAKEVAELRQEQAVGSKLKTAKEDELSAICALGNILQSIGDYEQSFEHYEKSLI